MLKVTLTAVAISLLSVACTQVDTSNAVERTLTKVRTAADILLERKMSAELEGMRESSELARIAREEALRFDKAKCHAGLPALRAYADLSEDNRKALEKDCGLTVVPGAATLEISR